MAENSTKENNLLTYDQLDKSDVLRKNFDLTDKTSAEFKEVVKISLTSVLNTMNLNFFQDLLTRAYCQGLHKSGTFKKGNRWAFWRTQPISTFEEVYFITRTSIRFLFHVKNYVL